MDRNIIKNEKQVHKKKPDENRLSAFTITLLVPLAIRFSCQSSNQIIKRESVSTKTELCVPSALYIKRC
jgi:hypothetical protein